MERWINIAFMVVLLIPVAGFLILQNHLLYRHLKKHTKHTKVKPWEKKPSKPSMVHDSTGEQNPISLRERRKKRYEERNKALYR